jgi:gluconate 5-dehydrogenase
MAKHLLDFGAQLVIADMVDSVPEELKYAAENGTLSLIRCDLSSTASIRALFENVYQRYGHIDVLINNAAYGGGAGGKAAPFKLDEVTDEVWNTGIDGTLSVTFRCMREVLPYFDKNPGGAIVNIASMYGMIAPDFSIYGASGAASPPFYGAGKAGVIQLTRYCASQLAPRGIRVNSITPGPFPKVTPAMDREFLSRLQNKTMLKETGDPNDLAGALILLASNASRFMTGANIVVDGGMTAM